MYCSHKILILLFFTLLTISVNAQIFETAAKPKKGEVTVGLNPLYTQEHWGLAGRASFGIGSGFDARFNYIFLDERKDYWGVDFGKNIISGTINLAARAGMHVKDGRFGLNCAGLADVDILKHSHLYSGVMLEVNFLKHRNTNLNVWVPIGLEWTCSKNVAFLAELDLGADDDTQNIYSAGIKITF